MTRLGSLDALRGVLALAVLSCHLTGAPWPSWVAGRAVDGFFILSGYVLCRGYDGRYAAFLARRAVRLWPVYAACITATALLAGTWPTLPQLLWWPDAMHTCLDAPAWSLFVEAAVTPALPLIFRLVRYPLPCIVCLVPALALPGSWPVWVLEFVAGAALAQVPIRWPPRVPRPLALLGRVSYPLSLCHWPCIAVGVAAFGLTWGPFASLPLIAVVTWGLYRWVEIPSITASRAVGRLRRAQWSAA